MQINQMCYNESFKGERMITKESIFEEFKIAKEKDIAKSKTPPPYENVFTNRIKLLESHRDVRNILINIVI